MLGALPIEKLSSVTYVTCHKNLIIVNHINFVKQYFASFIYIVVDIGFKGF